MFHASLLFVLSIVCLAPILDAQDSTPIYEGAAVGTMPNLASLQRRRISPVDDTDADGIADFVLQHSETTWELRSGATGGLRFVIGVPASGSGAETSEAIGLNDVDGDGAGDIALVCGDQLKVHSGATGLLIWAQTLVDFSGPFYLIWSFPTLARIPDANADGVDDIAVGFRSTSALAGGFLPSPPPASVAPVPPVVRIVSGANGATLSTIPNPSPATAYDLTVASAGDLNGDGNGDVIVQSLTNFGVNHDVHDGASGALLMSLPNPIATLPGHIAGGADIDGDGAPDIVVCDPASSDGAAHAYSGATGTLIRSVSGRTGSFFGFHPHLGDHDGDGVLDVAASSGYDSSTATFSRVDVISFTAGRVLNDSSPLSAPVETGILIDIDGDGRGDLIAAGQGVNGSPPHYGAIPGRQGLGEAANPNTSFPGLDANLLRVSGNDGGGFRSLRVGVGQALTFEIRPVPIFSPALDYAIFGYLGAALAADAYPFGGSVGSTAFIPAALLPAGVPTLFTLATSVPGLAGTVVQTPPGPQVINVPAGIPVAIDLTIQAIVLEPAQTLRKTNGILVSVR
jgi:VCBS repeat protein